MTSMTGFGHGEHRDSRVHLTLEIRSYNNRYLELAINLPYSLKQMEPRVREFLSARIIRGKVEFYLGVTEMEEDCEVHVDPARVRSYVNALGELKRLSGTRDRISLAHLIGLEGVMKSESRKDPEALWQMVLPLLEKVFAEFNASRAAEGRKTEADIRRSADEIRTRIAVVEARVPDIEARIRGALRDRFKELLGEGMDESRVLAETAVQLMRSDVNEEVQRMKAHLDSLFDALGRDGAHGKRLDFVCQELGREINTIGSKSVMLEVDQAVIAVKDSLEKVREQLRNVE
jgi:uncharacterized protein (TIGR00255 family)